MQCNGLSGMQENLKKSDGSKMVSSVKCKEFYEGDNSFGQ